MRDRKPGTKARGAVFVFGFAKNDLDNIGPDDLKILKRTAAETLALTEQEIATLLETESLIEVNCNDEENDDRHDL